MTKHKGVDLALLATCRQIYQEATGICYSINWIGMDCDTVLRFMNEIDSKRLESIRHVRMHIVPPLIFILSCLEINHCMSRVETVDVVVFDHGFEFDYSWEKSTAHPASIRPLPSSGNTSLHESVS